MGLLFRAEKREVLPFASLRSGWHLFFCGFEEPVEIRLAGGFWSEDEELGDVVGVEAAERGFDLVEVGGGGFDEEQDFFGFFDVALPAVDGREAGDDVDAGGEVFIDEEAGDALGFVAGAGGGEDEAGFGGGYYHRCGTRKT